MPDFTKTDEELKKELAPDVYKVAREKGTEAPFSGKLLHMDKDGVYKCAVCNNPLFSSDTKFDSGTGWPSFYDALPGAVVMKEDNEHGMHRTEVTCAKCGSHLGHVFNDAPQTPTGKRFCLNSVCLEFNEDGSTKTA